MREFFKRLWNDGLYRKDSKVVFIIFVLFLLFIILWSGLGCFGFIDKGHHYPEPPHYSYDSTMFIIP